MAKVNKSIDIYINDKNAGKTIGDLKKKSRQLNNEINRLTPGTQKYIDKVNQLKSTNKTLSNHRKNIRGIGDSYKKTSFKLGGLVKNFIGPAGIIAAVGLVAKGVTQWVQKNLQLEKSLSSLRSITGASKTDLQDYKKEAIEIGRTTTLSASQAVEGFKLIGSAKPELLKNKDALISVTKEAVTLAEAAELDLGPASQSLAGTLNQFNYAADQSSRVINVLAAGSKAGAADIISLNASLDKTGTIAAANNITLEDNVGLLETLAEKNIKGAEAGTQLKNVLLTMSTINALPPEATAQLEKYGVDTQLVADKTVPLQDRLKELAKIQNDSTALVKVFGKENLIAGQTLLENTDKVKAYTDAVTGTNVANEQAAINTDNLDGDLKSLSSAWEGLLLTISGSNSIIRPVIQLFTDIINGFTDIISLFKTGNQLGAETAFLKIGKALTYLNPFMFLFGDSLRDAIDDQIRFNELMAGVIDDIKDEARSVDILTSTLAQNNAVLKQGNLTTSEAAELNGQNAEIINKLKDTYPELTSEMDLQNASLSDLSELQKEVTQNLVDQAIETAKAAEQEKILNSIIDQTIELNKQKAKEANRSGVTNFIADIFADDAENISENIDKEKKKLFELDQTFNDVSNSINGLNLNYGADFDENTQIIIYAKEQLAALRKQLAETDSEAEKLTINAQIEAGTKLLENSGKVRKDVLDGILNDTTEAVKGNEEVITNTEKNASRKRASNRKKELDKLISDLEKLTDTAAQMQADFENKKKISLIADDQQKELAQLQIKLDKKYAKELDSAKQLASKKGEVGVKAQQQLDALLLLKQQELEFEKSVITDKYAEKRAQSEIEAQQKASELEIQLQESTLSLKVTRAAMAVKNSSDEEYSVRIELQKKLDEALAEQLAFEKEQQITALYDKLEAEEITEQEYRSRKEELEIQHQEKLNEIQSQADEKRKQRITNIINQSAQIASKVIDIIGKFREVSLNNSIKNINTETSYRIQKLETEYKQGKISKARYEREKEGITALSEKRIADEKTKAARKERSANTFQAVINTALAITKALASAPPPINIGLAAISGAAGAAQIAVINSQPLPQFKSGGYNVIGANDGKSYNANYIGTHQGGMLPSSPSIVLASEEGPEYYVPNPLLSNPVVANHVKIIEAIRTNQMVDGGVSDTTDTNTNVDSLSTEQIGIVGTNNEALVSVLSQLNSQLSNLKVVIGDAQVDAITNKQQEIAEIVGE